MKRNLRRLLIFFSAIFFCAHSLLAADSVRQRTTLDFDWKFSRGDPAQAQDAAFDDSAWTGVDLPHDWSIAGPFDQNAPAAGGGAYLPTGIGWYRKTFKAPDSARGHRVQIEFDGVYENSEVWINGHSLGKRPFGFISFVYDLTPFLDFNGDNVIAVRVDNSAQPNCRWYSGSGIYRHTWILVSDDLHIPQWGSYVTTPKVNSDAATVDAAVQVINQRAAAAQFDVIYTVLNGQGNRVQTAQTHGELNPGEQKAFTQQLQIDKPVLWSLQNPALYTLRCQLRSGDQLVDEYDTPFGIRTAVFDVDKGFLLNGLPVKMNGVCLHGDGGGVGVAVPEGVWIRRLQLLKQMGCNAIRTSHNPPAPEFLDLCDRMGFLVMDEAFDVWEQGKRANDYHIYFKQWWQRDLLDFIHRDRNHPSVVLWSAGNEIGDQTVSNGAETAKKLVDAFHQEDPTRLVTAACDRIAAEPRGTPPEFLAQLDVVGYNYVDRWRDRANKYYSLDRRAYPDRKFIGTESVSMSGVRGDDQWLFAPPATQPGRKYQKPPIGNTHIDVEQLWKFVGTNDYVAGDFMWTGIDYLGEEHWPNKIAAFGTLDTCGFKKDSYYFYQSQWTSTPVLHLLPHWNLKGREGQFIPVTCYTNCDTVELFLNGKSIGVKGYEFPRKGMEQSYGVYPPRAYLPRTTADLHLAWDVPYEPGVLKAVGSFKGETVTEEVATTGEPAGIELSVDKTSLTADRRDVGEFEVRVIDAQGRVVPTASNEVTFDLSGPARIISVDNGNPASDESFKTNHRNAFNGMCLAIIQTTGEGGLIRLTARSDGLKSATVEVHSERPGR